MSSLADDEVWDSEDDNESDGDGGLFELSDKRQDIDGPRDRSSRWCAQAHRSWSSAKADRESRAVRGRGPCTREGVLEIEPPLSDEDATSCSRKVVGMVTCRW